jgi:DNA replication protein DnaC
LHVQPRLCAVRRPQHKGSRRHEQGSIVVTTNLAFKQWGTIFPGAACVVALRFAQHCHVVDIAADSWRQKNSLRRPRK